MKGILTQFSVISLVTPLCFLCLTVVYAGSARFQNPNDFESRGEDNSVVVSKFGRISFDIDQSDDFPGQRQNAFPGQAQEVFLGKGRGVNGTPPSSQETTAGVSHAPEPGTMLLFGTGLIGLAWVSRKVLK